eukprot:1100263-Alexandrium_andersonii.AAC.1
MDTPWGPGGSNPERKQCTDTVGRGTRGIQEAATPNARCCKVPTFTRHGRLSDFRANAWCKASLKDASKGWLQLGSMLQMTFTANFTGSSMSPPSSNIFS